LARLPALARHRHRRSRGLGRAAAQALRPRRPNQNPLTGSPTRDWEKIYRDQYRYDSAFDWVCSPNDTHACRVRAYVRNGIVVRLGATYD
jgi:nitrate reductase / nitrite oxidoreductase, alpha subunit